MEKETRTPTPNKTMSRLTFSSQVRNQTASESRRATYITHL